MKQEYYRHYYHAERNHWFFLARNKIIMDYIRQLLGGGKGGEPLKILNVGVATGYTSVLLKEFGEITSIEYEESAYAFVMEHVEDIGLRLGSILELPFEDNSFDLVCAFDVVEHVMEDKLAVAELKRVCKNDAHVVITVPAFMSLWSNHDEINHHIKRYRQGEILKLFNDPDNIEFSGYFNFWLFPLVWIFRKLNNLLSASNGIYENGEVRSDLAVMSKPGMVSKLFYKIFASEGRRILKGKAFPFGVSILTSWKKPVG